MSSQRNKKEFDDFLTVFINFSIKKLHNKVNQFLNISNEPGMIGLFHYLLD